MSAKRMAEAALLAGVAMFVALSLRLDFLSDDAFIVFRYARNLARGEGLVFNPGDRVEGYTSFLSVVVIAALHRLGADPVAAGRALSLAGGAATVLGTFLLGRRLLPGRPLLAAGAALLVAANPYVAAWGAAGLETTLFSALLLLSALPVAGKVTTRRFFAASALGLLLSLARPEGVAIYGAILFASLAASQGRLADRVRALLPGILLFVVLGGVYFAGRWIYFGAPLPNTFYAKSGFSANHAVRGVRYLGAFIAALPTLGLLLPSLLGMVVSFRRREYLAPGLLLLILAMVVGEGGDGLPMYRFLVPAIPLLAVLFAVGIEAAIGRLGKRLGPGAATAAFAAGLLLSFFPPPDRQYRMFIIQRDQEIPRWSSVGRHLARAFPRDTVIAAVPIGAVAYHSGLPAIDLVGLTDREIAHASVPGLGSGRAGHEKHHSRSVLARQPGLLLLGNIFVTDSPALPPGMSLHSPIAAEKELVREPGFAELYVRGALALDDGGYLHLYVRRDLARS